MFSLHVVASTAPTSTRKKLLRTLPTEGPRVVMGPGENAGAVDVGGGLACAFKVESHNHPSAVEPFQGAATGVGGILRDVFAVGARPDRRARLAALRRAGVARARATCSTARSAGIGHYGNSIGVPTVGGEVYFEGPYEPNCLVNAMCARAWSRAERLIRSAAAGRRATSSCCSAPRRAATGSAARRCSPRPSSARPTRPSARRVQIGDPFEEKKLLECSLELLERGLLVSLQDLGAAGPDLVARRRWPPRARSGSTSTSTGCRCARPTWSPSRSWSPSPRSGCSCVVEPGAGRRGARGLREAGRCAATAIGEVTDTRPAARLRGDELVGDMPVRGARRRLPALRPRAARRRPRRCTRRRRAALDGARDPREIAARAARLAEHRLAPLPLFEQYDWIVGSRAPCAAPSRPTPPCSLLPDAQRRSRSSIDGNGRRVAVRPVPRARSRRCSSARPTSPASGAEPLGLTNCLNFGNPEKPHIAWQLTEAVARARRRLPRARRAGRRRQRVALQRGRRAGRSTRRRSSAWSASCPTPARAGRLGLRRATGDAVAFVGGPFGARARGVRAGEAARRGAAGRAAARRARASCARCTPRSARPSAAARCARRTTSPRAASPWRWPSAAWPAASARRSIRRAPRRRLFGEGAGRLAAAAHARGASAGPARARRGRRPRHVGGAALAGRGLRGAALRRGAGRVRGLRPGRRARAFGAAARIIGEVGGDALVLGGEAIPVAELARVHAGGLAAHLG